MTYQRLLYIGLPPVLLCIIYSFFIINASVESPLVSDVDPVIQIDFLEHSYHYALLLAASILFPFVLSFDRRVNFWQKRIPYLLATAIAGFFYLIWDVLFTKSGVWGFNPDYYKGPVIINLPWEELAFFIVIPYCCLFIYECVNVYFSQVRLTWEKWISIIWVMVLALIGLCYTGYLYTCLAFLFAAAMTIFHLIYSSSGRRTKIYLSWLLCLIPFLIVNGSLTGGFTKAPVVMYSASECIGLRIYTVPVEDAIYLYGYLLWLISVFDYFKKK